MLDKPTQPEEAGPRLLNLADRRAWEWLVEHVDGLIRSEGIDLYRQDFNIDPLPFWRAADAADRQGITENHYVVGFLRFWDELLRRHPDMLIDSCASGGRRNDLETLRRAVPLWRSDYAFEPIGHQCMTYGISLWLPYHGTGTVAYSAAPYYGSGLTLVEPYAFWSNATPSLGCGIDIRVRELDYEALRRLYRAWREFGQFYYADFYPLTRLPNLRGIGSGGSSTIRTHSPERFNCSVGKNARKSNTGFDSESWSRRSLIDSELWRDGLLWKPRVVS